MALAPTPLGRHPSDSARRGPAFVSSAGCARTWDSVWGAMIDAIRARLSRISSSGRIIPEIEGLRFVAIFGVLAYHVAGPMAAHFDGRVLERDPFYVIAAQG